MQICKYNNIMVGDQKTKAILPIQTHLLQREPLLLCAIHRTELIGY